MNSVKEIAFQVSKAETEDIPSFLVCIKDVFEKSQLTGTSLSDICSELWDYHLFHLAVSILKQDFANISGSWNTAADLAHIISTFSQNFHPCNKRTIKSYKNQLLLASSHILIVSSVLQEESSCEHEDCYQNILKDLGCLILEHPYLLPNIFNDKNFLCILMSNNVNKLLMALDLLNILLNISSRYGILLESHESISVFEELVSRLHSCIDPQVGKKIAHILLQWVENSSFAINILKNKNISKLITHRTAQGFHTELYCLIQLIEKNGISNDDELFQRSAVRIQSVYRGYRVRKRLKELNKSIAKFQRLYRMKKLKEQQKHQEYLKQVDAKYLEVINRTQKLQSLHKLQLQMIGMIPAGDVDSYLQEQLSRQATKIQAVWRGYRTRKEIKKMKEESKTHKAACTIQKQVRKWLTHRQRTCKTKSETTFYTQKPLDVDTTHLDILVKQWTLHHPVMLPERQQDRENLQIKSKDMLTNFYLSLPLHKKKESQLNTILLQLEADAALLTNPVPLEKVKSVDAKLFSSPSEPVASMGRMAHEKEMKALNCPKWKIMLGTDTPFETTK